MAYAFAEDNGLDFMFPPDNPEGSETVTITYKIHSEVPIGQDELRRRYDSTVVIPGDTSGEGGAAVDGV